MLVVRQGTSCTGKQVEHARALLARLTDEEKEWVRYLLFDVPLLGDYDAARLARNVAKDLCETHGLPRNTVRGLYDLS